MLRSKTELADSISGAILHLWAVSPETDWLIFLPTTAAADPSWNPSANGTVYALKVYETFLYVGGDFTSISGEARNRIAALSTSGWLTYFDPGANAAVRAIARIGNMVYAAGDFTSIGGAARNYLAAIYLSGIAAPWNLVANNRVYAPSCQRKYNLRRRRFHARSEPQ